MNSPLCFIVLFSTLISASFHLLEAASYTFRVKEARFTRLCKTKKILTVNGKFPGPTIYATKGEKLVVNVINRSPRNITIHWHGVKQRRNPWADGAEYITQCPIQPRSKFTHTIQLSNEQGTLFWHAHSKLYRATVHGAFIVYPEPGTTSHLPQPHAEVPLIIGEWWKEEIEVIYEAMTRTGGDLEMSDAFMINGQPGDFYDCSNKGTFKLSVDHGKTYLLRIINAAMQDSHFFAVANHSLTVVAVDGGYTKPVTTDYIGISPGQTMDVLLITNKPHNSYYMAARVYSSEFEHNPAINNSTTTAIIEYRGSSNRTHSNHHPWAPTLPYYSSVDSFLNFTGRLRSLADKAHPVHVPLKVKESLLIWVSINTFPCPKNYTCAGPHGRVLTASLNNISFVYPRVDVLRAYYYHSDGVFKTRFPNSPPLVINQTAEFTDKPLLYETPKRDTQVKLLKYNSTVEIVFQGSNIVAGSDHPMHLHGFNFYVVGQGSGDFDPNFHPSTYNLVDPPLQNTATVTRRGWIAVRFKADNPGVWFMHCHIDRHMEWGMEMVFIVRNGKTQDSRILSPPNDMPEC